jgi:hypothetical protein
VTPKENPPAAAADRGAGTERVEDTGRGTSSLPPLVVIDAASAGSVADVVHRADDVHLVLPIVREDDDPLVREGIARRRITATTGRCPCGATWSPPNRAARRAAARRGEVVMPEVVIEHEGDCPAGLGRVLR